VASPPSHALVGRNRELTSILAALRDPASRLVVVRGPAGSGKTALAESALADIRRAGGLVGGGVYGEGRARAPFGPIMRALSQATGQALDGLYDPEGGGEAMSKALGPALGTLHRTGFLADARLDFDVSETLVGRREGAARIIDASLKLVRWLGGFEKPVVLLVDDWWRGPSQARDLVLALVEAAPVGDVTVVVTERAAGSHDFPPAGHAPAILELGPLEAADRAALFQVLLGDAASAVTRWFGEGGPELPFDIRAAASALATSGALVLDDARWSVDSFRAAAVVGSDDLAAALVAPLPGLGAEIAEIALAVALWGEPAPIGGLVEALGVSETNLAKALARLRAAGIVGVTNGEASLTHDRLRAPVLAAMSESVDGLALAISGRLRDLPDERWGAVAAIGLHFRQLAGVEDLDAPRWRDRFAEGARLARSRADPDNAAALAEIAWRLRERAAPEDARADRRLLREAILAAADRKDPDAVLARLHLLFALDSSPLPRGDDYELAIAALRFSGAAHSAWEIGREGLARLGMRLPAAAKPRHLVVAAVRWRVERWLPRRAGSAAGRDGDDALVRIGNAAATLAFEFSPPMAALIAFRGSRLAGRPGSPFWLANDTFLLAMLGDYSAAFHTGEKAILALSREGEGGFSHAATLYRALFWGVIWRRPQGSLRDQSRRVRDLAVAEGDIVQAGVAIRNWILLGWRVSESLGDLEAEIGEARRDIERLGPRDIIGAVDGFLEAIRALRAPPGCVGAPMRPADWAPTTPAELLIALELASVDGDFAYGRRLAAANRDKSRAFDSHPGSVVWRFHESLSRLKTGARALAKDMAFVRRAARLNPADHGAKILILEAEALRLRRGPRACAEAYAEAVSAARGGASRLEAGLAAECAADACRAAGDPASAKGYADQAQATWRAWGALSKLAPNADAGVDDREDQLALRLAVAHGQVGEAERATRARSRFLAEIAHELRTPMQGMQSLIDLAAGDATAVDLPSLGHAFASLRTVVDDLTDFGAFSSGEAPLAPSPVRIADLLRSEALVAEAAAGTDARVAVEISPDVPEWVETDGARIRQVIRNLLSNAGKYGGGRIEAHLGVAAGHLAREEALALVVDDQGPGLTPFDLIHLFEPFERGARAGDGRGLGLGLSVSRRIAERLGGDLAGANRPLGGARFTFVFPLVRAVAPTVSTASGDCLRILLAEDEPLIRGLIAKLLRNDGHEVFEAEDGVQALALNAARTIDLAIVDLTMPRIGGVELLHLIAQAGPDGAPPSIVLTASGEMAAAAEARLAGAGMVLRKPVSAAELREAMAGLVPRMGRSSDERPTGFDAEMAELASAARVELVRRVPSLIAALTGDGVATPAQAHGVAGLAAQFGWAAIADAADAAERALAGGVPAPSEAAGALAVALESLSDQASVAVAASR